MDSKRTKIKTIFMGTPEFAAVILKALIKSDFLEIIAVICNPDSIIGRKQILTPPPAKILAQKYNIPVLQPDRIRSSEWIEKIKKLNPELIIVAAFGQIIPKKILDIPKYKTINVHGSLLPKLRGASPIQYAILDGLEKTGVTIMLIDEQMDHGQILGQKEIDILPSETFTTLSQKMSNIGASFLVEILKLWIDGKIKPQEQNHNEATYTKILRKEDGKINWTDTAEQIERKIRAFNPWPGTFCIYKDKMGKRRKLKILEANIAGCMEFESCLDLEIQPPKIDPGIILIRNSDVSIQTGKGCLKIIKVQPESKNSMITQEFINGYKYLIGETLN